MNFQFWKLEVETLRLNLMNHDSRDSLCCSCNMYFTNLWTWLMKIITSRWLMWYGSMINLCFFMFFISNSSFYMFLLTYMYQKLKNIYIFKKSLRDSLPNRELLKMVAPAPASAPASRSRFWKFEVKPIGRLSLLDLAYELWWGPFEFF